MGPPWPKHPCTDNSGTYKHLKPKPVALSTLPTYKWQLDGWNPFICLAIGKDKAGRIEIKGKIVTKPGESAEKGHLVYAYIQEAYKTLADLPIFIKEIDHTCGKYEIATYNLSPGGFKAEPIFVRVYVPSPYRPIHQNREQSRWAVVPLIRRKRKEKKTEANASVQTNNSKKLVAKKKAKRVKPKSRRNLVQPNINNQNPNHKSEVQSKVTGKEKKSTQTESNAPRSSQQSPKFTVRLLRPISVEEPFNKASTNRKK